MSETAALATFEKALGIYVQTKALIITAEETDPKVSSSIAIIREQRDALDHLMRVISDGYAQQPRGVAYCQENTEKAIGHFYRAAYDALDSLAISLKMRIAKAVGDYDNAALTAVFPEYFKTYCAEIDALNSRICQSRATKDVGAITDQHMIEYRQSVERMAEITRDAEQKVAALSEFSQRQKAAERKANDQKLRHQIMGGILLLLLAAFVGYLLKRF